MYTNLCYVLIILLHIELYDIISHIYIYIYIALPVEVRCYVFV